MATRQTLIDAIAKDGAMQKRSALCVLDAVLDNITIALEKDGVVQIAGFGTFRIETRPARTGRNPRTGEAVSVRSTASETCTGLNRAGSVTVSLMPLTTASDCWAAPGW